MKLAITKVCGKARVGVITCLGQNGEKMLEVPGCLLYTKMGSAPHLTHDTLQTVEGVPCVTQVPLAPLAEHQHVLEEYKEGIRQFAGLSDTLLYCSINDPATVKPSGYNTTLTVSVWGSSGRIELDSCRFIALQRALKVDWFQCLCDGEIMVDFARKRAKKSVDRSLVFLDECLELMARTEDLKDKVVIGAIEGGHVLEQRLRSARETAKRPVGGFLLDGFQEEAMMPDIRAKLLEPVLAELPEDKPRLMHGVGHPEDVLQCIELGVDLFDSSYPYQVTERGCALTFNHRLQPDPETEEEPTPSPPPDDTRIADVLAQDEICNAYLEEEDECDHMHYRLNNYEISLKDPRYIDDLSPLVPGCTCYCCRNHTRAYIHHLLMSRELLAGILLMIHNFQHYFAFFRSVRESIRKDKFEDLKNLIKMEKYRDT